MKWNWGTGIALSFTLFCTFIVVMVVRAFQYEVDLVSETYYSDELAYQDRIVEEYNLSESGLEVKLEQSEEVVSLKFPEAFSVSEGEVHFYHPSKPLLDQHYTLSLSDAAQQISKEKLAKGRYKVKINWTTGEMDYFQETEIFIK